MQIDYKNKLNKEQYEAATTIDGPVIIQAGAGTGKTTVLVHRVAYMIENGIRPENILLLTFTKKAANEMLERAKKILDIRCSQVIGGTYHSFALNMLKRYSDLSGFSKTFSIIDEKDEDDLYNIFVDVVAEEKKFDNISIKQYKEFKYVKTMSLSINKNIDFDKAALVQCNTLGLDLLVIKEIVERVKKFKESHYQINFDDMLVKFHDTLLLNEMFRNAVAQNIKYIMVDEYQDSNILQFDTLKLLCLRHNNISVVGDVMQSIYGFRGANASGFDNFRAWQKNNITIKLFRNYRSTQQILDYANNLMKGENPLSYNPLMSDNKTGCNVCIKPYVSPFDEDTFIANKINSMISNGKQPKDIAVLVRSGYFSNGLQFSLKRYKIPFVVIGGKSILEAAQIKDMLCYLRLINNPKDMIAWIRVLKLYPKVGIKTALKLAENVSEGKIDSLIEFIGKNKNRETKKLLIDFCRIYNSFDNGILTKENISELIRHYFILLVNNYDENTHKSRMSSIYNLKENLLTYETIQDFFEDTALNNDIKEEKDDNAVQITTIHSAKGLEYDAVFIMTNKDGEFPSDKAPIDEEKRLFYVAVTRARQELYVLYPKYNGVSSLMSLAEA